METLIYLVTFLIALLIPIIYFRRAQHESETSSQTLQKNIERGMGEPVSLHPKIDPDRCIGTGACVEACPEGKILGLIDNRGVLINPSRCIGHGMCQAACPVDAIDLVFGTEKRGVDIPYVKGTFETNISGIYIAGELGGMGLIRNAVTQGWEAVEYIAKSLTDKKGNGVLDLVIVGAGPAGLAASLQAKKEGLTFVTVDQEDMGGAILSYPRRKLVMTQPMELPLFGKVKIREIQKEELLDIFNEVKDSQSITINSGEKVTDVQKINGHFKVVTSKSEYETQRILLAIGRRGTPRKLGVPDEKSGKVSYRLIEPEKFTNQKILVVGGGDSAVEAAVALSEQPGNVVHLSYRRERIFRIKEGNRERLDAAVEKGDVQLILSSNVTQIEPERVVLDKEGETIELENDYVFVFAGGELPIPFLEKIGISVSKKFGER